MNNRFSILTRSYRISLFVVTLILCSYGVYTEVGGLTLRFEKVFILASLLVCCALFLRHNGRVRYTRAEIYLVGWFFISIISSALSANPLNAIKSTVDLGISASIFFVASTWKVERVVLSASRTLLSVGVLLGAGSAVIAALYYSGVIDNFPVLADLVMVEKKLARIKMTMYEANLFGAIMMVFSILSIAYLKRSSLWSWLCLISCHAGLLTAFSRGPFLGYVIGLLVYCHMLGYKKVKRLLVVITVIVLVMAALNVGDVTEKQVDEKTLTRTSTLLPRLLTFEYAVQDIKQSPLLGNGTYSIDSLHPGALKYVGSSGEKMWISLLPAAILHDTGLIGFIVFSLFLINIFRNGYRCIRQMLNTYCADPVIRRMAAWFGIGIGMLIVSLSTSAYSLAAFWMTLAMVASISKASRRLLAVKSKTIQS